MLIDLYFPGYLIVLEEKAISELAVVEFRRARNMSEQLGALSAISRIKGSTRDSCLDLFYQQWKHDNLVGVLPGSYFSLAYEISSCRFRSWTSGSVFRRLLQFLKMWKSVKHYWSIQRSTSRSPTRSAVASTLEIICVDSGIVFGLLSGLCSYWWFCLQSSKLSCQGWKRIWVPCWYGAQTGQNQCSGNFPRMISSWAKK